MSTGGWKWDLFAVVLFAGLSVWATFPLVTRLDSAIPTGKESSATVPLFNLWTVWWNADRLKHGLDNYWNAGIFRPVEGAFTLSEPQPTTLVVAPLVWWAGTPELAFNVYLLASLFLNGWSTWRLLRLVNISRPCAAIGGALVLMLPFVHWQLGVLQLVPLWGVIWTVIALVRYARRPSIAGSLRLGFAFGITFLLCGYYGLFVTLPLLLAGPVLIFDKLIRWRLWLKLLPGAAMAIALIAPVAVPQLQVIRAHQFTRELSYITDQSARAEHYAITPWKQLIEQPRKETDPKRARRGYSPGWLKVGLAMLGMVLLLPPWRRRKPEPVDETSAVSTQPVRPCVPRRWGWFVLLFGVSSALLSYGPRLAIGEFAPYVQIVKHLPGFEHARNVYRFAVFAQLAVCWLAAAGLHQVCQWNHVGLMRRVLTLLMLTIGIVAVFEVVPPPQPLYQPAWQQQQNWVEWIRDNTHPDDVIAHIPFPVGGNATAYLPTTEWMVYSSQHGRPMVNGYSGYFPERFFELKHALPDFPDNNSLKLLEEAGVTWCVVDTKRLAARNWHDFPDAIKRLQWAFSDYEAGMDIYRLVAADEL